MSSTNVAHFFVDEAGDLTLFGRRGKSLLGTEGVSWCFMVGMAQIDDPVALEADLTSLRRNLLADEYLKDIPSLRPEARKTALCFHAKDDCPEVRMEVFKRLALHPIRVQVGIHRKSELIKNVRLAHSWNPTWMNANSIYDDIVKRLFKRSLHTADENVVVFARRGKAAREVALAQALQRAQENFARDTGIQAAKPTQIRSTVPSNSAGLQAVDYFLWALQRLYERGEDRYFRFLAEHYRLIMDFDDGRQRTGYGRWYSERDPLTKEKMMPVTG